MTSIVVRHRRSVFYFLAGALAGFLVLSSLVTIELQRTPCYGICPIYTLRVWGNGLVAYHGEFGLVKGDRIGHIGPFEAWRLVWVALSGGFMRLDDIYTNGNEDEEGSRTCVSFGPFAKCVQVTFSLTAPMPPAGLRALNTLIDRVTRSEQWTGTPTQIRDQHLPGYSTQRP